MASRLARRPRPRSRGWTLVVGGGVTRRSRPVPRCSCAARACSRPYGLTETCGGIAYEGVPLPEIEVRTVEGGLVEVRGPTLFSGLSGRPAPRPRTPFDAEGWLATHDLGSLDADGHLKVVRPGRRRDPQRRRDDLAR